MNLFCKEQKVPSKQYKNNYDKVFKKNKKLVCKYCGSWEIVLDKKVNKLKCSFCHRFIDER